MIPKTKRSLLSKRKKIQPDISLPAWVGFWSLVLCTMIMIVVTFSAAIKPLLQAKSPGIGLAEVKLDLKVKNRN